MIQTLLHFDDPKESQRERCRRILSGDVGRYCLPAAKYFDGAEYERLTLLHTQTPKEPNDGNER